MRPDSEDGERSLDDDVTPPTEVRAVGRRSTPSPILPDLGADFTGPVEHFERDWNDAERAAFDALHRELGRDPTGPATVGHFLRLRIAWVRHATSQDAAIKGLADRQLQIENLDDRTKDVERWQKTADRAVAKAHKLFWSALVMFLLSLGGIGAVVWDRSAKETEARLKIEQAHDDNAELKRRFELTVEQLYQEINRLREQVYRRPTSLLTQPSNRADVSALKEGSVP